MDDQDLAFLSGGVEIAGGIAGAIASARQAAKNRRFQERMYKHRYQYQMQDMIKAGLNPILAFGNGAPSAPPGSMANFDNMARGGVASARTAYTARKEATLLDRQLENTKANTDSALAQEAKLRADAEVSASTAKGIAFDNVRKEEEAQFWKTEEGRKLLRGQLGAQRLPFGMDYAGGLLGMGAGGTAKSIKRELEQPYSWRGNKYGQWLNDEIDKILGGKK